VSENLHLPPGVTWPGKRLGLPQFGSRSIARPIRRIVALSIDWAIASLCSWIFFRTEQDTNAFVTLGIFAVLQYLFLLTLNGGIGHLICRMRLVPVHGGYLGAWRPAVRTALLCLAIPALIWDADQRGFHDKLSGTVLVRI